MLCVHPQGVQLHALAAVERLLKPGDAFAGTFGGGAFAKAGGTCCMHVLQIISLPFFLD